MTDQYTREMAVQYQQVDPETINGWWANHLDGQVTSILEIGAGTGRDAKWIRSKRPDASITVVEPSSMFREYLNKDTSLTVVDDALPDLRKVIHANTKYDLILLNAVFMHVRPDQHQRVFRKLANLLRPGGRLVILTKLDHPEPARGQFEVSNGDIQRLATEQALVVQHESLATDELGRNFLWGRYVLRLPDDGTGALPLLRRIVVNDRKSSTYKLALLRVFCRVASELPGTGKLVQKEKSTLVELPAGLVALYWIRAYLPLLQNDIPQSPRNANGRDWLAFAPEDDFAQVITWAPSDLYLGARISLSTVGPLMNYLNATVDTILDGPANHITLDGTSIVTVRKSSAERPKDALVTIEWLRTFGTISLPAHIWQAFRTHDLWIEPAILNQWQALSSQWLAKFERKISPAILTQAFSWPNSAVRDTKLVAKRFSELGAASCVWSGAKITPGQLNIDHAIPFAHWPCNQLWNLFPTTKTINSQKSDRIPDPKTLSTSKHRILDWWRNGFIDHESWSERFWVEAHAGLPALNGSQDENDLFEAMCLQANRLRTDYRLPEWAVK